MSDTAGGSFTLDTSQAVASAGALATAFGKIGQSGVAMFAVMEEGGNELERLGSGLESLMGNVVGTASAIQQAQAQLTAQTYNFNESLGQNQAQSAATTKQLITMATSIKQPISSIQQLAGTVAQMGYSGSQIPILTKDFAEFGAVTNTNMGVYAKSVNQIAVQTHTGAGSMNSLLSALYAVQKQTSGGMPGLLSMTDRMASLSMSTGMTGQEFVALAAFSQNFDSRLRGGAYGALQQFDDLLGKSAYDPHKIGFFTFLGNGSEQAGKQIANTTDTFKLFSTFLTDLSKQTPQGFRNALQNMGLTGTNAVSAFGELASAQSGSQSLQSYMNTANQAWSAGTDVQTAYQAVMATTASQMTGMRDTVQSLANTVGQDLLPVMSMGAHVFQDVAGAASIIPTPILAAVAGFIGLAGAMTVVAGVGTKVVAIWGAVGKIKGIAGGSTAKTKTEDSAATNKDTAANTANTASISENTAALVANTEALMANLAAKEANSESSIVMAEPPATGGRVSGVGAAEEETGAEAETATQGVSQLDQGLVKATSSSGGLMASLGGLQGALMGVAAGVGVFSIAMVTGAAIEESFANKAKGVVGSFSKGVDTTSIKTITAGINAANDAAKQAEAQGKKGGSLFKQTFEWSNIKSFGGAHDVPVKEVKDYKAEVTNLQQTLSAATGIASDFWKTANPSQDQINQVLSTASQNLINITSGGVQAKQSIESLLSTQITTTTSQNQQKNQQDLDAQGQAISNLVQAKMSLIQSTDSVTEAELQENEAHRQLINFVYTLANAQNQLAEADLGVQQASVSTAQAQIQEKQAAMELSSAAVVLADDEAKVTDAKLQQQSATLSLLQAQLAAGEAATEQTLGLETATNKYAQSQTQAEGAVISLSAAQWSYFKLGADYANQYQSALNSVADTTLSLQTAQISAANAQWQLTYLQEEGASQRDIQLAQLTLAKANQQVTDTQTQLTGAQQQANQMPTDHAIALAQSQNQLQSAQEGVTSSTIQEQQAQIDLTNAQAEAADNSTIKQANINLGLAQDKVTESANAILQAQIQVNNVQNGSIQLQYNAAVLNVQQSELKQKDAAYAIITAQMNLNTLQDGSIQLAYKRAQDQVTAANWQVAQSTAEVAQDQQTLGDNLNNAYTQAQNLASVLIKSGNPQLEKMGSLIEAQLPSMEGYSNALSDSSNNAATLAGGLQSAGLYASELNQALASGTPIMSNWTKAATPATTIFMPGRGPVDAAPPSAALGAMVTSEGLVHVHSPELIVPLNDPSRAQQLLQSAGLLDSYGVPSATISSAGYGGVPSPTVSSSSTATTNNFYLTAMSQADPEEIMDAFAWKQRLVSA